VPSFEWISTLLPADCTVLQSVCLRVVCPVTYRKRHIRTAAKHTLSVAMAWSSDEMKYFILWITSRLVWSCHPLNWQMNLSLAGTMDTICTVSFKDHSRQVHLPPQGATAQPVDGSIWYYTVREYVIHNDRQGQSLMYVYNCRVG